LIHLIVHVIIIRLVCILIASIYAETTRLKTTRDDNYYILAKKLSPCVWYCYFQKYTIPIITIYKFTSFTNKICWNLYYIHSVYCNTPNHYPKKNYLYFFIKINLYLYGIAVWYLMTLICLINLYNILIEY